MNSENIKEIGRWVVILALVASAIACVLTNRPEFTPGFIVGALVLMFSS